MLKIGKVASLYGITVQTLRHYDKIGLFQPEMVSPETGYRYYSVRQLRHLEYILFFRQLGLSLPEIQSIMERFRQGETWADALGYHVSYIEEQITLLRERQSVLQRITAEPEPVTGPMETVTIERISPVRHFLLRTIQPLAVSDPQFSLRLLEERKQLLGMIPSVQTAFTFGAVVSMSDYRSDHTLRYMGIIMDPGPYQTPPPADSIASPEGYYASIRFDRDRFQPEQAYDLLDRFLTEHRFQADDRILETGHPSGFSSISRISSITELMVRVEL